MNSLEVLSSLEKKASRDCPVCESQHVQVLHTQKFVLPKGHPLAAGYEVVRCRECGFVYADTTATQDEYDEFYARLSKYEEGTTATGSGAESWDIERLEVTARCIAEQWPDKDACLLDVGCANGGLLVALQKLGYSGLCGVDPSPVCVANTERHGIEGRLGTLSSLPEDLEGQFDGVILSHVIEHVRDVRASLDQLKKLLKPGGQIYIEVPDATRYTELYISPFHFFDTEHINHFSRASMANLLLGCGFEVVGWGHKELAVTEGVFYPALWMVGRLSSVVAPELEMDAELAPAIMHYIERSRDDFDPSMLEVLANQGRPLIVWGVGCSTLRLLANSALGRANIQAFVDNNPKSWGTTLATRLVISPADLSARGEAILITSKLYGSQIEHQIRHELKLENEMLCSFRG